MCVYSIYIYKPYVYLLVTKSSTFIHTYIYTDVHTNIHTDGGDRGAEGQVLTIKEKNHGIQGGQDS